MDIPSPEHVEETVPGKCKGTEYVAIALPQSFMDGAQ